MRFLIYLFLQEVIWLDELRSVSFGQTYIIKHKNRIWGLKGSNVEQSEHNNSKVFEYSYCIFVLKHGYYISYHYNRRQINTQRI